MERRVGVTETLLTGAESSKVGGSLWDSLVIKLEFDGSNWRAVGRDLEENV